MEDFNGRGVNIEEEIALKAASSIYDSCPYAIPTSAPYKAVVDLIYKQCIENDKAQKEIEKNESHDRALGLSEEDKKIFEAAVSEICKSQQESERRSPGYFCVDENKIKLDVLDIMESKKSEGSWDTMSDKMKVFLIKSGFEILDSKRLLEKMRKNRPKA